MTAFSCFLRTRISRANGSNCARGIGLRTGKRSTPGGVTVANSDIHQKLPPALMGVNERPYRLDHLCPPLWRHAHLAVGYVQDPSQQDEWDHCQPIRVGAGKERVVVAGPRVD